MSASRYDAIGNIRCTACREFLPASCFAHSRAKTGNAAGRRWPQSKCRICYSKAMRIKRNGQ